MNTSLHIKSSSRAGRFKKKLVSEEFLKTEAPLIEQRMQSILEKFHQNFISSAEFTAIYILTTLAYRAPGTWLGAKRSKGLSESHGLSYPLKQISEFWEPNIQKRLEGLSTIGEVFNLFAFKGTPLSVNRAILGWSAGAYGLELMFRIPKPAEVLNQQKLGRRCVTVILEKEKASKFILGERDALGFTMHDLIHADHFYHNNHCYQGQLGFYGFLAFCVSEDHFKELNQQPAFEAEFEYLISDMNAYAIHLMKCFKSAMIHYHPEGQAFFISWTQKFEFTAPQQEAFLSLNTPAYVGSQDTVLLDYLNGWKRI